MPLNEQVRDTALSYCDAHLDARAYTHASFSFIEDQPLQKRLADEFYAARYIYKLGEALSADEVRLNAHTKFQIVQYASIYEAVIIHLLWTKYAEHPALTRIEFHNTLKRHSASLPSSLQLIDNETGAEILFCLSVSQRTPRVSIKFDDKVDAAVQIGFLDLNLGEEIKSFYRLRNAIHLESAIKNDVSYDLDSSQLAYRRMQPFLAGIRGFLESGTLPNEARVGEVSSVKDAAVNLPPWP